LFSANSSFVKYWNNWIILLALYNSILIPLEVFYADKGHSFYSGPYITFIDACVDLFFLIDIIICFRTIIIDPSQSLEVKDPHKIGIKYLKGNFTIDFLSSVPFAEIFCSDKPSTAKSILTALGLLKMFRINRLYKTVQQSNMD
jgi:hypothetical protein